MALEEKQKIWILSFPSAKKLTSGINEAIKANKIGWVETKEIYEYWEKHKDNKLL